MFLGEDLLPWLVLAFGAALAVGNGLALVRPPRGDDPDEEPTRPPLARTAAAVSSIDATAMVHSKPRVGTPGISSRRPCSAPRMPGGPPAGASIW